MYHDESRKERRGERERETKTKRKEERTSKKNGYSKKDKKLNSARPLIFLFLLSSRLLSPRFLHLFLRTHASGEFRNRKTSCGGSRNTMVTVGSLGAKAAPGDILKGRMVEWER